MIFDIAFDFFAEPCSIRAGSDEEAELTLTKGVFSTSHVVINEVQTKAISVRLKQYITESNIFIIRGDIEYRIIESQPDNFGGSLCILKRV